MNANTQKLLLVEDNPGDARLIVELLRNRTRAVYEPVHVQTLSEAQAKLGQEDFHAVLLDLGLPDSRGAHTVRAVFHTAPDTPIVVLTGQDEDQMGVEAVREGAQDYLSKNQLDERLLRRTLRYAIERHGLQQRLRKLIEQNVDGVVVVDQEGVIRYLNPVAESLFGARAGDVFGELFGLPALAGNGSEIEITDAGGNRRSVETRMAQIEWDRGEGASLFFLHDITERRRAQQLLRRTNEELEERVALRTASLRRANRALQTLSSCNEVLVHARTESALLQNICRNIVEVGGYRFAWVGYAMHDAQRTVEERARAGGDDGYLDEIAVHWADDELGRGPAGRAIRTNEVVVARDLANHPEFAPWREAALRRGFASAIALPLRDRNQVFGVLILYSEESDAFDEEEINLLSELAEDVGFGIQALRAQADRESARLQLREKEQLLAGMIETAPSLIVLTDAEGNILEFNRACEELTGYTRAEICGHSIANLVPEEWMQTVQECIMSPDDSVLRTPHENPWRTKSGEERLIEWRCTPVSATEGGQPCVLGIGVDITERRRAEAEMRKLSSAVEQAPDSVFITDLEGKIEYVNPAFEQITGYTRDEALGRTPRILNSGFQDEAFHKRLWSIILEGETFRDVFLNRRKDGRLYYEDKTITSIRDHRGAITHFISAGKDITERMQAEERMQRLANYDALTDLPNRALLLDRTAQALKRAEWRKRNVALLLLDVDRFKVVNEGLGHEAGDRLLKSIAARLQMSVREGDTVARVGSDEFAIMLDDVASEDDVGPVAQKILSVFHQPFGVEQQEVFLSASMGISHYPRDPHDPKTLLKNAQSAMTRAKGKGRNRFQFYTADMDQHSSRRLMLETDLRRALQRSEFRLLYQPQLPVAADRLFGVEALLRWEHPAQGTISPAEFIPMLEETDLIIPVGRWVLEQACAQLRDWIRQGLPPMAIAVNLSAVQFRQEDLAEMIGTVLQDAGLDPSSLEVEITESVIMQHQEHTIETLRKLSQSGVRIAVDDFGTGYSSLSYLTRFPVDLLKVDRSFVRNVPGSPHDEEVVRAVIALAHGLRLKVTAEGVETEAQHKFLRQHGCDAVQGFLFGRPMTAEQIGQFLHDQLRTAPAARR